MYFGLVENWDIVFLDLSTTGEIQKYYLIEKAACGKLPYFLLKKTEQIWCAYQYHTQTESLPRQPLLMPRPQRHWCHWRWSCCCRPRGPRDRPGGAWVSPWGCCPHRYGPPAPCSAAVGGSSPHHHYQHRHLQAAAALLKQGNNINIQ